MRKSYKLKVWIGYGSIAGDTDLTFDILEYTHQVMES